MPAFQGAQRTPDALRKNAHEVGAQFEFFPNPEGIAQGALNSPPGIGGKLRTRNPSGLFGGHENDLSKLELTERQITAAIAEKSGELTAYQTEQAPWWGMWREVVREHDRMVDEQGFRLGGEQAAFRRKSVTTLSELRAVLAPAFVNASRLTGEINSLKNRLRSTQTEIKIVKDKIRKGAKP